MFHGPPTDPAKDRDLHYRIKAKDNRTLRQEFFAKYIPKIWELGLTLPDPEVRFDADTNEWKYTEPDWNELKMVVTGHGPKSQARLDLRRMAYADTQWVRDVVLGKEPVAA
jgi:ring-1,2-phenylacetyl-CoA epoxidase subunit PaaA